MRTENCITKLCSMMDNETSLAWNIMVNIFEGDGGTWTKRAFIT